MDNVGIEAGSDRTGKVGSRTFVAAASAGPESHGQYMHNCRVDYGAIAPFVKSEEGIETGDEDAVAVEDEIERDPTWCERSFWVKVLLIAPSWGDRPAIGIPYHNQQIMEGTPSLLIVVSAAYIWTPQTMQE